MPRFVSKEEADPPCQSLLSTLEATSCRLFFSSKSHRNHYHAGSSIADQRLLEIHSVLQAPYESSREIERGRSASSS